MKNCDRCNEPFTPREAKQRFCCRACSDAWFANERREAVRRYRATELSGDARVD
jgi:DNA-directed RNA polymerase subunit RPC12/RpoP